MRIADRFRHQLAFKSAIRNSDHRSEHAKTFGVANLRSSQRPANILEAIQSLFDDVDTCGVTEPDGAIVTESSSRNDRDVGFTQQAVGEILRGQTELTDIHRQVKRARRLN